MPTFSEAYEVSIGSYNERSLKSLIKSHSFLQKILSSSIAVFRDLESDVAFGIRMLGNST